MNIKELLEGQDKTLFTTIIKTPPTWTDNDSRTQLERVTDWHKQSLLQFIDYLIEDLRGKKKNTKIRSVVGMSEAICSGCGKQEGCTCDAYNQSIDDQITHLLSIKKEIESISTNESASH